MTLVTTNNTEEQAPKLLVIDDDNGVTDIFKMIAQELQFDFQCVHGFEDITDAYLAFVPDIIFLDLKLPGHDGVEVLQLLSKLGCKSKIYIVSGLDQSTLESASALGRLDKLNIKGTLKKPFLIDDVERMLLEETDSSASFTSSNLQELFGPGEFRLYFRPGITLQDTDNLNLRDLEISASWTSDKDSSAIPNWLIARKLESEEQASEHSKTVLSKAVELISGLRNKIQCGLYFYPHSELFSDSEFPFYISELVKKFNIPPGSLTLGIHESEILGKSQEVLNIVTRLRISGFNISVEITGTDTDALGTLLHLPINEMRLCPELTATITRSVDAEFEISTLISACKKRGIATRADGIADESLLRFLSECGCTIGHGKHLAHPLRHQELEAFVAQLDGSSDNTVSKHATRRG